MCLLLCVAYIGQVTETNLKMMMMMMMMYQLLELGLPSFDTLLYNSRVRLVNQV